MCICIPLFLLYWQFRDAFSGRVLNACEDAESDFQVAKSEEAYLLELWDRKICPNCGNSIPEGKRVGSGQKRKGGFCCLKCYGNYYAAELAERAQRLATRFGHQEDSRK